MLHCKMRHSDLVAFLDLQKELAPPVASPFETAASRPPQGEGTGVASSRHVIARSASDEAIHSSLCDAVDCFAALAMTAEHDFAISRRIAPEACLIVGPHENRGRREDRVRAAPAVSRAKCTRQNAHEHTGSAGASRPSLRSGFTAYFVLSPVNGFFATVIPEKLASQELDASTAASGPHDFAVRSGHVRLAHLSASTAPRAQRP